MVTKEEGMQVKTCKKKKKENNKNIFFFSSFRARSVYLPNSGQAGLRKSQATRLIVFPKIRYRTLASPFICAYFGDILEAAPVAWDITGGLQRSCYFACTPLQNVF